MRTVSHLVCSAHNRFSSLTGIYLRTFTSIGRDDIGVEFEFGEDVSIGDQNDELAYGAPDIPVR